MGNRYFSSNTGKRLDAWVSLSERQKTLNLPTGPTITISREFGCEAFPLAESLQKKMRETTGEEWPIYDRALFEEASKDSGISKKVFANIDSPLHEMDLFSAFSTDWKSRNELYDVLSKIVRKIAKQGNCIIVGRGGAFLTSELENCFNVRLEASESFRINSLMGRYDLELKEATQTVKDGERDRKHFIEKFFHKKFSDPEYFDLRINNERFTIKEMTILIHDHIMRKFY